MIEHAFDAISGLRFGSSEEVLYVMPQATKIVNIIHRFSSRI